LKIVLAVSTKHTGQISVQSIFSQFQAINPQNKRQHEVDDGYGEKVCASHLSFLAVYHMYVTHVYGTPFMPKMQKSIQQSVDNLTKPTVNLTKSITQMVIRAFNKSIIPNGHPRI
jgi:uncharacterized Tic20 family protein